MGLHSLAQVDIERLSGAVILDLSGNELTEIDSLQSKTVRELDISGNPISVDSFRRVRLPRLKFLRSTLTQPQLVAFYEQVCLERFQSVLFDQPCVGTYRMAVRLDHGGREQYRLAVEGVPTETHILVHHINFKCRSLVKLRESNLSDPIELKVHGNNGVLCIAIWLPRTRSCTVNYVDFELQQTIVRRNLCMGGYCELWTKSGQMQPREQSVGGVAIKFTSPILSNRRNTVSVECHGLQVVAMRYYQTQLVTEMLKQLQAACNFSSTSYRSIQDGLAAALRDFNRTHRAETLASNSRVVLSIPICGTMVRLPLWLTQITGGNGWYVPNQSGTLVVCLAQFCDGTEVRDKYTFSLEWVDQVLVQQPVRCRLVEHAESFAVELSCGLMAGSWVCFYLDGALAQAGGSLTLAKGVLNGRSGYITATAQVPGRPAAIHAENQVFYRPTAQTQTLQDTSKWVLYKEPNEESEDIEEPEVIVAEVQGEREEIAGDIWENSSSDEETATQKQDPGITMPELQSPTMVEQQGEGGQDTDGQKDTVKQCLGTEDVQAGRDLSHQSVQD